MPPKRWLFWCSWQFSRATQSKISVCLIRIWLLRRQSSWKCNETGRWPARLLQSRGPSGCEEQGVCLSPQAPLGLQEHTEPVWRDHFSPTFQIMKLRLAVKSGLRCHCWKEVEPGQSRSSPARPESFLGTGTGDTTDRRPSALFTGLGHCLLRPVSSSTYFLALGFWVWTLPLDSLFLAHFTLVLLSIAT